MTARSRQALWLVLACIGASLWLAGPASQSLNIPSLCHEGGSCPAYRLDVSGASALTTHGLSLSSYAAFTIVLLGLLSVIWYGLAGLIMLRKPVDRGANLAAFFLVTFPMLEVATWIPWAPSIVKTVLPAAGVSVLLIFCLLFPDGTFTPGWSIWLLPFAILGGVSSAFPVPIRAALVVGILVGVTLAQLTRFRTASSWAQRQQTKWALFGVAAAIAGLVLLALGFLLLPSHQTHAGGLFTSFANSTGIAIAASPIPITIAIAILRYHLWDINRVISLTLVYASLTAILAALYIGGVIGLQHLLQPVTGGGSSPAIVLTTLAVAALFGPLRSRIQIWIDRRFYRQRYDAVQTLQALGKRLRDEVDLARLSEDVTQVVHETLRPEHVSLWLAREESED